MGHVQCLYSNGVVHGQGEDGILQMEWTILISKSRLKIEMGSKDIIVEHKHLFNQWYIDLWGIHGKDNWL